MHLYWFEVDFEIKKPCDLFNHNSDPQRLSQVILGIEQIQLATKGGLLEKKDEFYVVDDLKIMLFFTK